jgi:hypothetical protein
VTEYPIAQRPHAQEVAETLEEVLRAVVAKKTDKLPPRPKFGQG